MAFPNEEQRMSQGEYPYKDFEDNEVRKYPLPALVIDSSITGEEVLAAVRFLFKYQKVKENFHVLVEVLCSLVYSELRVAGDISETVFGVLLSNDPRLDWSRDYIVESGTEKVFNLKCFGSASQSTSGDDHAFEREKEAMRRVEEEYESLGCNQRDDVPYVMADRTSLSIEERAYIGGWAFALIVVCAKKRSDYVKYWATKEIPLDSVKKLYASGDDSLFDAFRVLKFDDTTYDLLSERIHRSDNRHYLGVIIRCLAIYKSLGGSTQICYTEGVLGTLSEFRFMRLLYSRMTIYCMVFEAASATRESPLTVLKRLRVSELTDASVDWMVKFLKSYARKGFFNGPPEEAMYPVLMVESHSRSRFLPIARLIDPSYVSSLRSTKNRALLAALVTIVRGLIPNSPWKGYHPGNCPSAVEGRQLGLDYVARVRRSFPDRSSFSSLCYTPDRFGPLWYRGTNRYRFQLEGLLQYLRE